MSGVIDGEVTTGEEFGLFGWGEGDDVDVAVVGFWGVGGDYVVKVEVEGVEVWGVVSGTVYDAGGGKYGFEDEGL